MKKLMTRGMIVAVVGSIVLSASTASAIRIAPHSPPINGPARPVPDTGSTAPLLGLALGGLAVLRRKLKAK